ncbi:MAG: methyltransferase domain-containing protein [Clostridia bacterium]|nr:methyltransferase domain-containing protein [Clostridia bacterium]
MNYFDKNALKLSHAHFRAHIKEGDTVIDATAGRGRDTLLLSTLVGDRGKVFAFDIQEEAISSTRTLLTAHGRKNVTLIHDSHHKLCSYVNEAAAVVFNFGFLPGGDHSVFSRPDTSIKAIDAALSILKEDGFVSLCIYYGGDTGFEEHDAILAHLQSLDPPKYTVMLQSFFNRKNCPPLFAIIEKNRVPAACLPLRSFRARP